MAVAMYTTLAGLVGSILLKIQYYMLDSATAKHVRARGRSDRDACGRRRSERAPLMIDDFGLYPARGALRSVQRRCCSRRCRSSPFCSSSPCSRSSPEAKEGKIDSKAEFIVTMDWPDNHPDDLDLFVQDPLGNIAWYRHREAGFLVLDRDDRGGANDFIVVNGRKIASPIREEIVTHSRHRRRRIHRQRQPLPGDDWPARAGEREGAEAQSDGAGRFRRQRRSSTTPATRRPLCGSRSTPRAR